MIALEGIRQLCKTKAAWIWTDDRKKPNYSRHEEVDDLIAIEEDRRQLRCSFNNKVTEI